MKYFSFQRISSTQDLAKEYLSGQAEEAAVFTANQQTAGYGKNGRYFYSPPRTGLYFSLALPNFTFKDGKSGLLTPALAVAIINSLKQFFPEAQLKIKWVNDLYYADRKIAGILTEIAANGLVIGVGLNLSTAVFPAQLRKHAGSLHSKGIRPDLVLPVLVKSLIKASQTYWTGSFWAEYHKLSYLTSKQVVLKIGKKIVRGRVKTVANDGRLVLLCGNSLSFYSSGEVTKVLLPNRAINNSDGNC